MRELFRGLLLVARSPREGMQSRVVRQFVKFLVVGTVNTATSFLVYALTTRLFSLDPLIANGIAFLVAVTVSFFLNKSWTFRDRERTYLRQYSTFFYISGVGFAISEFSLYLFHKVVGLHDILAYFIATGIALLWNFNANRAWTFSQRPELQ